MIAKKKTKKLASTLKLKVDDNMHFDLSTLELLNCMYIQYTV